jgi:hypothetical protein
MQYSEYNVAYLEAICTVMSTAVAQVRYVQRARRGVYRRPDAGVHVPTNVAPARSTVEKTTKCVSSRAAIRTITTPINQLRRR